MDSVITSGHPVLLSFYLKSVRNGFPLHHMESWALFIAACDCATCAGRPESQHGAVYPRLQIEDFVLGLGDQMSEHGKYLQLSPSEVKLEKARGSVP